MIVQSVRNIVRVVRYLLFGICIAFLLYEGIQLYDLYAYKQHTSRYNVNSSWTPSRTRAFGSMNDLYMYETTRSKCLWHAPTTERNYMYHHYDAEEYARETWMDFLLGENVDTMDWEQSIEKCRLDTNRSSEHSFIERVGPFHTFGGNDWNRFKWENVADLSQNAHPLFVTSSAILLMSPNNNSYTNPPYNSHHIHLNTPLAMYPYRHGILPAGFPEMQIQEAHLFHQIHGDSMCHSSGSSTGCAFLHLPSGTGIPLIRNEVSVVAEIQDVRQKNASVLTFSLEVFLKTAIGIKRPVYMWLFEDYPCVYPWSLETMKFVTQKVRAGNSLHWKTRRITKTLLFRSVWFHTHNRWTSDMWLFQGGAKDVGMEVWPYVRRFWWDMVELSSFNLTHIDAQQTS